MRYHILGPLEVESERGRVELGGPKPRALLACLLLRPGQVVSTDQLIDAVWGAGPPSHALRVVRSYVSRLRGGLGADRIRYRPPGYLVSVADGELDSTVFELRTGNAQAMLAAGDPAGALAEFDAALALWRGDALSEFSDLGFARAEAARLAELRAAAIDDRVDALLAMGRNAEVVPELEARAERYPTRERGVAQLMRALYASGRQDDAIASYHRLRRALDDELGVEPSGVVRDAFRRVLEHDPQPVSTPPRSNLPRYATTFVGRDAEAAELRGRVRPGAVITLVGAGGTGKTRLAVEVAAKQATDFADGAWLCELASLADAAVGNGVAAALRVQQRHGMTIEQSVVEYLRHRTLLLVVDNCEHVMTPASELVGAVVRHCPGVAVLATSRERLGVDGEQTWPVGPLADPDAARLFEQRARAVRPDFVMDTPAATQVRQICARLDGLPLAIELAAARASSMSVGELAARLGNGLRPLAVRHAAEVRHRSLDVAIDWSYRMLPPAEQLLFARASVFAGGADAAGVHGVCAAMGAEEDDTRDMLAGLTDKSMVVAQHRPVGTRFRLLETLRAFGREQLSPDDRAALDQRHAEYYAAHIEKAALAMLGPDEGIWSARVLPDYDNLRAALAHAVLAGDIDLALRLVTSLPELTHSRMGYESAMWAERTLEQTPTDHPLLPAAAGMGARMAWARHDFPTARRLAQRACGRQPGPGTARTTHPGDVLADVALSEGDVATALQHYRAEETLALDRADDARLAWVLFRLSICHLADRDLLRELATARRCLLTAQATRNPTSESIGHYTVGLALKRSDPAAAVEHLDRAAEVAASVQSHFWANVALMEASATRTAQGDTTAAARGLLTTLDHWDRIGDRVQRWQNLRCIARLLIRLDRPTDAAALHRGITAENDHPIDLNHDSEQPAPAPSGGEAVTALAAHLLRQLI